MTCGEGQWREPSEERCPGGDGGEDVLRAHRELAGSLLCAPSRWFKMLETATDLL